VCLIVSEWIEYGFPSGFSDGLARIDSWPKPLIDGLSGWHRLLALIGHIIRHSVSHPFPPHPTSTLIVHTLLGAGLKSQHSFITDARLELSNSLSLSLFLLSAIISVSYLAACGQPSSVRARQGSRTLGLCRPFSCTQTDMVKS